MMPRSKSRSEKWKWAIVSSLTIPMFFALLDLTRFSALSPVSTKARVRQRIMTTQHKSPSEQTISQHYVANDEEKLVYGPYEEGYYPPVTKEIQLENANNETPQNEPTQEEDTLDDQKYQQAKMTNEENIASMGQYDSSSYSESAEKENIDEEDNIDQDDSDSNSREEDDKDDDDDEEEEQNTKDKEETEEDEPLSFAGIPTYELSAEWTRRMLISGIMPSQSGEADPNFLSPERLDPGFMAPLLWRYNEQLVCPYSRLVGAPKELQEELQLFVDDSGLAGLFDSLLYDGANVLPPGGEKLFHLGKDSEYIVKKTPEDEEECDMYWIKTATEIGHERVLQALTRSGFDLVLESMAEQFESYSLAITGVEFMLASHCNGGQPHLDNPGAEQYVYKLILPLIEPEDDSFSLDIGGYIDEDLHLAELKLEPSTALLLSGEAYHRIHDFDTRQRRDFRVTIAINIADIKDTRIAMLVARDKTAYFPPNEGYKWIASQRGRHFGGSEGGSLEFDNGREPFEVTDALGESICQERAMEGLCDTDLEGTRIECLKTCGVLMSVEDYLQFFPTKAAQSQSERNLFPF